MTGAMSTLEFAVRRLTKPSADKYPRPWMTGAAHPDKARVFVVGYNQATGYCSKLVGDHDTYIDSLFNRNGQTCDALYQRMRGSSDPSPARKNIYALRKQLADVGIDDVIETNVICWSSPTSRVLKPSDKAIGRKIFKEILEIIRPSVLIVHGIGAYKEYARVHPTYSPMILRIPSLAPPAWHKWHERAPQLMQETCARASDFVNRRP